MSTTENDSFLADEDPKGRLGESSDFSALGKPLAKIRLNGSIPWEIEFCNGVSHLNADLARFQLHSLDILGGASQIQMAISNLSGTTFIYISGGIHQSAIRMPPSAAIRVKISRGSTNLTFEGQCFGVTREETNLECPNFENAASRYEICIAGGASNLTIGRKE